MLNNLSGEKFGPGTRYDPKLVGLHDAHGSSLTQLQSKVQCY